MFPAVTNAAAAWTALLGLCAQYCVLVLFHSGGGWSNSGGDGGSKVRKPLEGKPLKPLARKPQRGRCCGHLHHTSNLTDNFATRHQLTAQMTASLCAGEVIKSFGEALEKGHESLWFIQTIYYRHQVTNFLQKLVTTTITAYSPNKIAATQIARAAMCLGRTFDPRPPWHQAGSQGLTQWHLLPRLPIGALAKPPNHQTTPPTAWQGKGNRRDCHIYATCAPVLYHADCGLDGADYS